MFEDNGCVRAYFVPPELLAGGAILCILDTRRDMCIDLAIQRPSGAIDVVLIEPFTLRPPRTGPPFDGWNWRRAFVPVHRELHTHERPRFQLFVYLKRKHDERAAAHQAEKKPHKPPGK
ncbi:hypothetical protein HYQ46_001251 [Verticillium longisporum]|nr:hypothetical protein HYQ46_001251 [Verticillium longisporum]